VRSSLYVKFITAIGKVCRKSLLCHLHYIGTNSNLHFELKEKPH